MFWVFLKKQKTLHESLTKVTAQVKTTWLSSSETLLNVLAFQWLTALCHYVSHQSQKRKPSPPPKSLDLFKHSCIKPFSPLRTIKALLFFPVDVTSQKTATQRGSLVMILMVQKGHMESGALQGHIALPVRCFAGGCTHWKDQGA